ncbi:hypothetical protein Nmel_015455 [Mimus melanotis]|uniref:Uncharacterized protein n=1 Tax=Bambusicola thoracicus TaxID=9083 RepID=A0A2P4SRY6_BAMTH|nr:hypothetical protein CIB84_009391 [Bambusicola thoracicus]
MAGSAVAAVGI